MALARTSPRTRKPATKARPAPASKLPKEWPTPGFAAFRQLSPVDRAWVTEVQPWYQRSHLAGDPSCMRDFEETDPLLAERERHYPFFVKFFRTNPRLFNFALVYFSGEAMLARGIPSLHKAWKDWLKARAQHRQAAE